MDVDIQEPQVIEIVDPGIPQTDSATIEPALVHQLAVEVEPMPSIQQVDPKLLTSSKVRT